MKIELGYTWKQDENSATKNSELVSVVGVPEIACAFTREMLKRGLVIWLQSQHRSASNPLRYAKDSKGITKEVQWSTYVDRFNNPSKGGLTAEQRAARDKAIAEEAANNKVILLIKKALEKGNDPQAIADMLDVSVELVMSCK